MAVHQERRRQQSEESPFDPAPAAGASGGGYSESAPPPSPFQNVQAGAGSSSTVDPYHVGTGNPFARGIPNPFANLFDAGPAPKPIAPTVPNTSTDPKSNVILFEGITMNKQESDAAASTLNGPVRTFSAYDGQNAGTQDPSNVWVDRGYDFLALNSYSNTADSMYIDPKTGKVKSSDQAAMNQDLHYDTALTAPQDYLSAADIGKAGADALLATTDGSKPGRNDPLVLDAHSAGGQSAFYTAVELHNRGYTNIEINGYDMSMTPHERELLEQMGVDVSNATGTVDVMGHQWMNPTAIGIDLFNNVLHADSPLDAAKGLINSYYGISDYYDDKVQLEAGDVLSHGQNADEMLFGWHEFHHYGPSIEYLNQQNGRPTGASPQPKGIVEPKVDASAHLDANHGTASGHLNLAGTTLNLPGGPKVIGDWAQASAAVDLPHGAGHINVGGDGGLGADVNLSQGQIDLNLFGHHVDVDQAYKQASQGVSSTVKNVAQGIQQTGQNVGNFVQNTAQSVSNWLFGAPKNTGSPTGASSPSKPATTTVPKSSASPASGAPYSVATGASQAKQGATQAASSWLGGLSQTVSSWFGGGSSSSATSNQPAGAAKSAPPSASGSAGAAKSAPLSTSGSAGAIKAAPTPPTAQKTQPSKQAVSSEDPKGSTGRVSTPPPSSAPKAVASPSPSGGSATKTSAEKLARDPVPNSRSQTNQKVFHGR